MPGSTTGAHGPQAVLRARVSSKEQEEDGFSLSAQIRLLREYAAHHGIVIVRDFVDVESSAKGGSGGLHRDGGFSKKAS